MQLIKKKEFAAAALSQENETFVVYVVFLVILKESILFCKFQIASLEIDKDPTIVFL